MIQVDPRDVVLAFVESINQHNIESLCNLMTADHEFVDSLGNRVKGREEMRKAWIGYFYLIPDYRISCSQMLRDENTVALFGIARGTYAVQGELLKKNRWEMPVSFRAVVKEGCISEWQVFADNEPVRQIMAAAEPKTGAGIPATKH